MARLEAVANAWFYPTPQTLLHDISRLASFRRTVRLLDPCAGDGVAATTVFRHVVDAISGPYTIKDLVLLELDASRFVQAEAAAAAVTSNSTVLYGDSFRADSKSYMANALWLNPPYDTCPTYRRMEHRWIRQFTPWLEVGGVLWFVVPDYALPTCAEFLGTHYRDIAVLRFPEPDYSVYKQVVLVAQRCTPVVPREDVLDLLRHAPDRELPVLGQDRVTPVECVSGGAYGTPEIRQVNAANAVAAAAARGPWTALDKRGAVTPIVGTLGEFASLDDVDRQEVYECPLPLTATHVATAIAGGLLDGVVLLPDDGSSLPPIAVRGTYDRRWHSVGVKHNKDGAKVAQLEQQMPSLIIVAVDLQTGCAVELAQSVEPSFTEEALAAAAAERCCHCGAAAQSNEQCVSGRRGHEVAPGSGCVELQSPIQLFSAGDLLRHYGRSLRTTLDDRCRPLMTEEAAAATPIPGGFPRRPWTAQRARITAGVEMVRRGQRGVLIAGETGTGKTTISAQVAAVVSGRLSGGDGRARGRVLVVTPAHVAPEWVKNQVPEILGRDGVRVRSVTRVRDVEEWVAEDVSDSLSVAVVPRSMGKLGYAVRPMEGASCPRCGGVSPEAEVGDARAKKRLRCSRVELVPQTFAARAVKAAAQALFPIANDLKGIRAMVPDRLARRSVKENASVDSERGDAALRVAIASLLRTPDSPPRALLWLAHALDDDDVRVAVADSLYAAEHRRLARVGYSLLKDATKAKAIFLKLHQREVEAGVDGAAESSAADGWPETIDFDRRFHGVLPASTRAVSSAISEMGIADLEKLDPVHWSHKVCGHPLYGAESPAWGDAPWRSLVLRESELQGEWDICERDELRDRMSRGDALRRYPVLKYIHDRHADKVDFAISDESHEASNSDTAASIADQLLYQLGCPWIAMTGTFSNGYARSLFVPLWFASAKFRADYGYGDGARFQRDCGYNKRKVEEVDSQGRVVEYGSTSAARTRVTPSSSPAPGIVPTAVMRYLLQVALAIRIEDLELELPACAERVVDVTAMSDQLSNWRRLETTLKDRLKKDRFTEVGGALLGQLAQAHTYLDRCTADVGNCADGSYTAAYPARIGGAVVVSLDGFDPALVLPKEQKLVDYCVAAKAVGDRVIVGIQHVGADHETHGSRTLPERLCSLMAAAGLRVEYMSSHRVAPAKRVEWIDRINKRGNDVLLVHPRAVMTGLNNLVTYNHLVFFEPHGSANEYGQARGRVHRPGQDKPTHVVTMVYDDTSQVRLHDQLMRKVAVCRATGGSDPLDALRAVGADDAGAVATQGFAEMLLAA